MEIAGDDDLQPDWFFDEQSDEDLVEAWEDAEPAAESAAADVIRCKHCGSIRVGPRSSRPDDPRQQFRCRDCNRHFYVDLPLGYDRVYVRRLQRPRL